MKNRLTGTLSLTLLLSTPFALQALPGNPYDQQKAVNQEISDLTKTIESLKTQRNAIEPQQQALTLTVSQKGTDAALLIKAGQDINDLNLLAAQTALVIAQKEAELKATQAKLPGLAARIKTLEPSDKKEMFHEYQKNLPGIQDWTTENFTYCETTKVPSKEDKTKKTNQLTIAQSDKSAPALPTTEEYTKILEEREARKNQSWGSYIASFVYSPKPTQAPKPTPKPTEENKQ